MSMIKIESVTRRAFALTGEQAHDVWASGALSAQNHVWMRLGETMGFIWSTIGDLRFDWSGIAGSTPPIGASFTAEAIVQVEDQQAVSWLDDRRKRQGVGYGTPSRDTILAAFVAGRTAGFAMGSKAPQPGALGGKVSIDTTHAETVVAFCESAITLLNEAAQRFREYEMHHNAKAEPGPGRWYAIVEARAPERRAKAAYNGEIAGRIEALLSDGIPESTSPAAVVKTVEHALDAGLIEVNPAEKLHITRHRDPGIAGRMMQPDADPPRTSSSGLDPDVLDAMRQAAAGGSAVSKPFEGSVVAGLEAKINADIEKAFREGVPPGHETDIALIAHKVAPGYDVTIWRDDRSRMPKVRLAKSDEPL